MPWWYYKFLSFFSNLLRFLSHFSLCYCHLFSLTSISVIICICWLYGSSIFMWSYACRTLYGFTDSGKEWNYAPGTLNPLRYAIQSLWRIGQPTQDLNCYFLSCTASLPLNGTKLHCLVTERFALAQGRYVIVSGSVSFTANMTIDWQ